MGRKKIEPLKEHSELCETRGYRTKCPECSKKYDAKKHRINYKRLSERKKITRSVTERKASKYAYLFCTECKSCSNVHKDLCPTCFRKYKSTISSNSRKKIQELRTYDAASQAKITTDANKGQMTFDKTMKDSCGVEKLNSKSKSRKKLRGLSAVKKSNDRKIVEKVADFNSKSKVIKKSKNKVSNCKIRTKKQKMKTPNEDTNRLEKICSNSIEKNSDKYTDKTIANNLSMINGTIGRSPRKQRQVFESAIKKMAIEDQNIILSKVLPNIKEKLAGDLFKKLTEQLCDGKRKSALTYKILQVFSTVIDGKTYRSICENFGIGRNKAGQYRKKRIIHNLIRMPQQTVSDIHTFYKRDDISRVTPSARETTKKYGPRRYMNFPFKVAYGIFKKENPTTKISFSKFHALKPKNVRDICNSPLISSLCVYCQNVNLILQKLNIPGLRTEYDLFSKYICEKIAPNTFRRADCIFKKCAKCKNWEVPLRNEFQNNTNINKEIIWHVWENQAYTTRAGISSTRRAFTTKSNTVKVCIDELISNHLQKPLIRCTFFEHFYTQIYQQKMYQLCKKNARIGFMIIIQDFSRNREVMYQFEIKSSYWTKKQITMHPSVIYLLDCNGKWQRLVITHLSDITKHDAHFVHYMTKDCIQHVVKYFSEVKFVKVFIWSDGCSAQYKGKVSFWYLNRLKVELPQIKEFQRNYFGSEHGKGESDAETGRFSKQIQDGIKSENAFLSNASEMCQFLSNKNSKRDSPIDACAPLPTAEASGARKHLESTRIFKIVTKSDLEEIYSAFKDVDLKTLAGNCTRSLHQIMPGTRANTLLTRKFSCFCKNCLDGKFKFCDNKSFTSGEFISRDLPLNTSNARNNDTFSDFDEEDGESNYIYSDDNLLNEGETKYLQIKQEKLELNDLKENDFVITSLCEGKRKHYYVAEIIDFDDDEGVIINYLKQHETHDDIFIDTGFESWKNYAVPVDSIVMKLSQPEMYQRGNKYQFNYKINLKNIRI